MRRFIYILSAALALTFTITSCGGGAKAVKVFQKVVESDDAKKTVQTIARSGDDVIRHISFNTVTCATYGQVEFVDDYNIYL